jgi:protein-disulfide isomerase
VEKEFAASMKCRAFPYRPFAVLGLLAAALAFSVPAPATQTPNQAATREKIIQYIRQRFHIPDKVKVTVGDFRASVYPDFYAVALTLDDGKEKRTQPFFVSKDGRYLVDGNIYTLGGDARKDVVQLISLEDEATQGPATAPVTFVEYSDMQCPVCAGFHETLETDIIPKYGDKLRVVFKEFPLTSIHDWALTGAIATQCAYEIDPAKYISYRSLIYKNQSGLDPDHIRDQLLHLAAEAGIDNMKLASCIDSQASLPRIEASTREAQALGITQTPTIFINGRAVLGAAPLDEIYKLIDEAMNDAK